jgi:prefoldin subunit 5
MTEERSLPDEGGSQPENRPLDLNRASVDELTGLNGVGEVLARRIIAARPFRSVDDLSRVQGISSALIDQIRSQVMVVEALNELPDEAGQISLTADEPPASTEKEAAFVYPADGEAVEAEPEILPAETYPSEMFSVPEPPARGVENVTFPGTRPEPPGIPATKAAAPDKSTTSPTPAQPTRRTISPSDILWITAGSSLLAILISVFVTLGVLAAINGGLNFIRPAELVQIERRLNSMSANTEIIENEVNNLRSRLGNLEGLSGRVSSVEQIGESLQETVSEAQDNLDELDSQIGAISAGIEEVQEDIKTVQQDALRFNTFLSGLAELLSGVTDSGDESEANPGE